MKPMVRLCLVFAACILAMPSPARALPDAEATAGRLILRRYADAIVSVKAMVSLKVIVNDHSMPAREEAIDINGTVITPQGLTATSLSAIDPKTFFEAIRMQMSQTNMAVTLGQSEIKGLRLQLADGTEVPAQLVWKDADRDLAFIMPDKPLAGGRAFTFVNLHEAPEAAIVLGNYYHLSRLPEVMQRAAIIRPSTVMGIIERPRRMLLVSTDMTPDAMGCPVFDAQGRMLGICLRYVVNNQAKGFVVVSAGDIVGQMANF
ncbi:MAG: serine protease [Opitutaceae bacterium]|nr:serine protease [Opitutaceae bacterium]